MSGVEEPEIPVSGAVFTFGKSRFADNIPSYFFIRNDAIVDMDCGDEHTAVVCQNGRVFTFGNNEWGQLGLGHRAAAGKPSCVKSLKPYKMEHVACGRAHTLFRSESGKVYACGNNSDGQLGLEDTKDKDVPTLIEPLSKVTQLSAGFRHSAALTDSGIMYVWGSNSEGQLGLGTEVTLVATPQLLQTDQHIIRVACGYYHTVILTGDGKIVVFGEGESGKLGLGDKTSRYVPTTVPLFTHISYIDAGGQHTAAITQDGTLLVWGSNERGQLGLEDVTEAVTPTTVPCIPSDSLQMVSCGESHTAIVTDGGSLLTCGESRHGKLGLQSASDSSYCQRVPSKVLKFSNLFVNKVKCGGCHTVVLAKPPIQIAGDMVLESIEKDFTGGMLISSSSSRSTLPPLQKTSSSVISPLPGIAPTNMSLPQHPRDSETAFSQYPPVQTSSLNGDNIPSPTQSPSSITDIPENVSSQEEGSVQSSRTGGGVEASTISKGAESSITVEHDPAIEAEVIGNGITGFPKQQEVTSEGKISRFFTRLKKPNSRQRNSGANNHFEGSMNSESHKKSQMCTII